MTAVSKALSPTLHLVQLSGGDLRADGPASMLPLCNAACDAGAKAIILDLGAPKGFNHAGLAGLVDICGRYSPRVRLALCNIGTDLTLRLTSFGIERALPLYRNVEEALQSPVFRQQRLAGTRAVVLCGGTGSRLQPLTSRTPRAMLDILGRPLVSHVLAHLQRYGLNDVVLNPGHLGMQIIDDLGQDTGRTQSLFFVPEGRQTTNGWTGSPIGTAATLARLQATHFAFTNDTFVLGADALSDIDLGNMLDCHRASGAAVTIATHEVPSDGLEKHSLIQATEDGRITGLKRRPNTYETTRRVASTGIYLFRADVLQSLPDIQGQDIEADLIPRLLRQNVHIQAYSQPFSWFPVFCGRDYFLAIAGVLRGNVPFVQPSGHCLERRLWIEPSAVIEPGAELVGPCYVGKNARVAAGARLVGPCAVGEGAVIEGQTLVRESIIWAGMTVEQGMWIDQMIAGPDWSFIHHYADGRRAAAMGDLSDGFDDRPMVKSA